MTAGLKAERYVESARGCAIDLSDNTNLWGSPPSAAAILSNANAAALSRYPSAYSDELKAAIASVNDVDASMIVVGCGSDDIIDSILRATAEPGDVLAQLTPTFSMVRTFAACSRLEVRDIPRRSSDLIAEIHRSNPSIVYTCSPNNPTGDLIPAETIRRIVDDAKGVVIVDEAYIDFGGTSALGLLRDRTNLMITRTFSKAYGLAGLRVGYAIGDPQLIDRVEATRGPYKVTTTAERVAIEVLQNDRGWVADKVSQTITNRRRFTQELIDLGLKPIESEANFVLVPVENATLISDDLRARGISVRSFCGLQGIGDALRITVGPWEMMSQCIAALGEIVS
jgi:histidinol-phosphate aminotransferase